MRFFSFNGIISYICKPKEDSKKEEKDKKLDRGKLESNAEEKESKFPA